MKLFYAGIVAFVLSLAVLVVCVFWSGWSPCGDTPCTAGPVTTVAPAGYATPAVTAAEPAQCTELSRLALPRTDAPFTVTDEKIEGRSSPGNSGSPGEFGAVRTYMVTYIHGPEDTTGRLFAQMIVEFQPGNASRFYTYLNQQASSGSSGTMKLDTDPRIGDRSFAFRATDSSGSDGYPSVGIAFIRANVVEIIMLRAPGASSAMVDPLARKAAALVPAGGTVPPAVVTTAPAILAVPTVSEASEASALTRAAAATQDLLVWYDFEDDFTATRVVKDRSGSGRDATVTGTVSPGNGIAGTQGITFTGNGYLLAADNPAAGRKAVTFSFWFRTADPTRNYKFASAAVWRGGPGTGWTMATHRPEFWADDGPEDLIVPAQPNGDNAFVPGTWTHEVVVYEGKTMKEYTNGTLINNWQGRDVPMSKGVPMAVGGWPQFSGYNYVGQMDDFRIYDRALSAQEVAGLYAEGLP